jgi:hypothetical protein
MIGSGRQLLAGAALSPHQEVTAELGEASDPVPALPQAGIDERAALSDHRPAETADVGCVDKETVPNPEDTPLRQDRLRATFTRDEESIAAPEIDDPRDPIADPQLSVPTGDQAIIHLNIRAPPCATNAQGKVP